MAESYWIRSDLSKIKQSGSHSFLVAFDLSKVKQLEQANLLKRIWFCQKLNNEVIDRAEFVKSWTVSRWKTLVLCLVSLIKQISFKKETVLSQAKLKTDLNIVKSFNGQIIWLVFHGMINICFYLHRFWKLQFIGKKGKRMPYIYITSMVQAIFFHFG